jgi:serine/threonine protein kinase
LYTSLGNQKSAHANPLMWIRSPDGYTGEMNPTQLGPYTIQSRLGRGGMGAVYEAVDTTSGDTVAVKVLASHLAVSRS